MITPLISLEAIIFLLAAVISRFIEESQRSQYEQYAIWILFAYAVLSIIAWTHGCITQITSHLGIYCFNLNKRERKQKKL